MIGGFGMKKDLMHVSNPHECFLCKKIFLAPQDLTSQSNTFHSNHHLSTFSSSAATPPTTFRHYTRPDPALCGRNRFNLNYYRIGHHIDEQGRFHKGFPANTSANNSNHLFGQQENPKLMNLFPAMPSERFRTLPLLCQLEERRPQDPQYTTTERGGDMSSSIDLTLRL
ncbi:C2H2-like zinc finger protein [Raphanus sativus]|nr:C2H2-like zinc finger protein [Raphanus sativus]